jgi:hypothetical protein
MDCKYFTKLKYKKEKLKIKISFSFFFYINPNLDNDFSVTIINSHPLAANSLTAACHFA